MNAKLKHGAAAVAIQMRNAQGGQPANLDELSLQLRTQISELDALIKKKEKALENVPDDLATDLANRAKQIEGIASDIEQIKNDLVNQAKNLRQEDQEDIAAILIRNKDAVDQASIMYARSKSVSDSVTFEGIKTRNIITLAGISNKVGNAADAKDITGRTSVYRPLNIIDLINWIPADSETAYYLRETTANFLAGIIPEAENKPESDLQLGMLQLSVGTIAHFVRVSKQALKNMAQLAVYIETRLAYGVRLKLEYYVVNGHTPAQGQQKIFSGLLEPLNYTTVDVHLSDTAIDVLNKAKYKAAATYVQPDCIILNPEDWGRIERIKGTDGHYVFGAPGAAVQPVIWGVPVVFSATMPVGKYWCGPLSMAYEGYLDSDVTIVVSTEDANNVTKNLVTILAEMDGSGAVVLPDACVAGELPAIGNAPNAPVVTTNTAAKLEGTAAQGSVVTVTSNGVAVGVQLVGQSGQFSFAPNPVEEGDQALVTTTLAGLTSSGTVVVGPAA
ncbi:phage major capsid protein [Acinetobacter soli]|uniref:phage major capsid protein n=1 Tax=Acinetobacter soli TaxID=487316 RepID=UPI001230D048|nr:phage major capsid protein [Acinetobacter soli]